ncbi:MAG: phosphate ABC transporter ATP-binding protein [Nitrospirae bacterium]|nr:phosphate ABC transporter ATP-binding protein [Nitrospirota bacterium]
MNLSLSILNISKTYNSKKALNNCSFAFEKGNIYCIVGPNGSGKSTLLRISALIEDADEGKVIYQNGSEPLDNSIELRRRITLVFPKGGLFNTTVFKNCAYGLNLRRKDKGYIKEKVEEALREVGLVHKMEQNALTLSSGEAQRLALARAIALETDALFLDEPTASLDPTSVIIIEKIINTLKKKRRIIIMATHNMFQVQRLADEVVFLYNGEVVETANVKDFFKNPKDERTLQFINGEMIY